MGLPGNRTVLREGGCDSYQVTPSPNFYHKKKKRWLTTTIFLSVTCYNVTMLSLGVIQNTKPAPSVRVPQFKPFVKQVLWNAEALTELFYGAKGGKVLPQKTQNKEQAETGVKRLGENGERTDSNRIKRTFVYGIQAIFISKESKCNRPEYLAGDRV